MEKNVRDILGDQFGEKIVEKVGKELEKESGKNVGGCLGEIDKLNLFLKLVYLL